MGAGMADLALPSRIRTAKTDFLLYNAGPEPLGMAGARDERTLFPGGSMPWFDQGVGSDARIGSHVFPFRGFALPPTPGMQQTS